MALVHESFGIGTTSSLILTIPEGNPTTDVAITNTDNNTIYIGDATVTTSGADRGLPIKKDSVYVIKLNAEDKLYAVASIATASDAVCILYSRVV